MLFNSFEFAIFFPIVTILYFLLPHKLRWLLLLLSSCVFYMYFKPEYILILALVIVIDYFVGIKIENEATEKKKRIWLILSIIANLGILFIFKYYNFVAENFNYALQTFQLHGNLPILHILLPIGLSFHTLQAMSYTIEVSRGKVKAERHFGIYALYVMFYPQLVAGPIERPQNIMHQFHEVKYFNYENVRKGLLLMAWGLFKKVVIADRLALFVNQVHSMPADYYSGIPLILSYIAFPFQIYCDFSGYSDIAIGCAKVMGYDLMINFKTPILQKNINRYWATWHISLTTWFRDYVYMPLRKNVFPNAGLWLSVVVVLVLSGIWHGASWNYILWGLLNALIVIIYNYLKHKKFFAAITNKMSNWMSIVFTYSLIFLTLIFFRTPTVHKALTLMANMFKNIPQQVVQIIQNKHGARLDLLYLKQSGLDFCLGFGLIAVLIFFESKFKDKNIDSWILAKPKMYRWAMYYFLIFMFVFFGIFKKSEFIYFQF